MTSFTRKLYNKDPAAAEAFRKAQDFERQMQYGKAVTLAQFTPSSHGLVPAFGKRVYKDVGDWIRDNPNNGSGIPPRHTACERNCRHPACVKGCTLR